MSLLASGVGSISVGAVRWLHDVRSEEGYSSLAHAVTEQAATQAAGPGGLEEDADHATDQDAEEAASQGAVGIDWAGLASLNPDVRAWVRVDGTPIDYPVMSGSTKEVDHYLSHDAWDEDAPVGCPYLDPGCEAWSTNRIVYAHRLSTTNGMFTSVAESYLRDEFETLGSCRWLTPEGGEEVFQPLCALQVTDDDDSVRRLSWPNRPALGSWLSDLCERADTKSPSWKMLSSSARNLVMLVTCSSRDGGPRRTVTVFCR
ncbi:MAG: class B sortase [Atopobiaceae bacterium]|nr:class B sortase [Atopobiaceae bacterium]MCI2207684.1 class B sortase [Atopobiaceae bacterium]